MKEKLQAPPPSALINEALTPLQFPWLALHSGSLALAPKGRGQRVLVWPGFGAGNASTVVLRAYLRYLGYDATGWSLGQNDGDVLRALEQLKAELLAIGEPVSLVGWSLGGYLAREVARDCPESVQCVFTLGSPVVGGPKYTSIARMFSARGTSIDEIERLVEARYATPLTVPVTALYSKADGVVAWRACIDDRSPNVEHVEVFSSHAGLGFSPQVFRVLADRLARTV